ncbi:NAD-dependent epimerase/dehydratase family protein [Ramlibacter sp. WS9]|uniref:NAD-dependent epimerase/dehydratase family protein n=1 Tax=Ramlibacter sp. WS9 TaxID=1882741 RepID=UPI001144A543|nr:NAD-dependent epimerase/dehydratase family protein [Ramlibacter sp. WS9]ROZ79135.1 NAD-dependent epimerase/dehydratase family protein [Ramlibacter sp. WS9]
MNGRSVLLLGGTGFIGTALGTRLEQEGFVVHTVGRTDIWRLEQSLRVCGTVVHLASATTPSSSAGQPALELENVALTSRLLGALQPHPETHLIYFSSGGAIYGNPLRLPVPEDAPLFPLSDHGAAKASQEALCKAAHDQGRAVSILRPSNAYGAGQKLKSGFGLVRTLLDHAFHGTTLEIWGDGENVRDYIYIDDVVEATVRLIRLPHDRRTYNLGSGIGASVNQLRRMVELVSGRPVNTVYRAARSIDVRGVVLDTSRIRQHLGWQPKVSLADGLDLAWNWLNKK